MLVAGERSPGALVALGDGRLKASAATLEAALTGLFREVHGFEIAMHLRRAVGADSQAPLGSPGLR